MSDVRNQIKAPPAATFIAAAFGAAIFASSALADEGKAKEKFEPGEPFFGENAFIGTELGFGYKLYGFDKKREMEFSAGLK